MRKTASAVMVSIGLAIMITCLFTGCQTTKQPSYSQPDSLYDTSLEQVRHSQEITYPVNWPELKESERSRIPVLSKTPVLGRFFPSRSQMYDYGLLPPELVHVSEDEIWVIARPPVSEYPDDATPDGSSMLVCFPGEDLQKPLPLKHTDVKGRISGYIATVDVTQQFHNPYMEKIEATYVFPLPQNAAINEFIMTIGTRKIRGIIREKQEAEKIYEQAKRQGHTASLMTQQRPNIFTQKVANIESGKSIDVSIKYFNTLAYSDGWYEFVFPMVVGPRYNPPYTTDGIGAVAAGNAGVSGQNRVQYLKPHERSGHDISLAVDINAGVKIEKIECRSHSISQKTHSHQAATVTLKSRYNIPNKDFVLRYKVAGQTLKHSFVSHNGKHGSFFTLMLYPPEQYDASNRVPMEMIFVLDCSGSMSGQPIAKAKGAIKRAIKKLGSNDTFQVIQFSSKASKLGAYPLVANSENIRRGLRYVDKLKGGGGTRMIEGIKAALDFPHDPHRLRLVSFMTDGYIGNETEILAAVHERLGSSQIFSFGIGSAPNRYLLDRLAKLGNGAVAYVGLNDNSDRVVDLFYDRIRHPVLMDISIDWGGLQVSDVYPSKIPDIFPDRPVILTGRYNSHYPTGIRITGRVGDVYQQKTISVLDDESYYGHEGIGFVWARKKIEELSARMIAERDAGFIEQIKQTALKHGLISTYTAFVAVDSTRKTQGNYGVTVAVPVPLPDGIRYDTTVTE